MALRSREYGQQEDVSFPHSEVVNECKDLTMSGTPLRYRPLCRLYSSASPNIGPSRSSNIMSKKVKAKKMLLPDRLDNPEEMMQASSPPKKSPVVFVYSRRNRVPLFPPCERQESFYSSLIRRLESQKLVLAISKLAQEPEFNKDAIDSNNDPVFQPNTMEEVSRKSENHSELYNLSLESGGSPILKGSRSRGTRSQVPHGSAPKKPRLNGDFLADDKRRWIELNFDGVDSAMLLGLQCKVYWPLDDKWYSGRILGYKEDTKLHQVKYTDGDTENLILANEKIKFLVCRQEIQNRKLNIVGNSTEDIMVDCNEMAALAAIMESGEEPEPGDIVWAKITGHAMWPAIVLRESTASDDEASKIFRGRSIHVQFFGTHDFARVNSKNIMPFLRGLISSFHLKCKKPDFHEGLKEAKRYLNEQKLPRKMMHSQRGSDVDDCESAIADEAKNTDLNKCFQRDHSMPKEHRVNDHLPFEIDGLKVINLGRRIKDPENLKRGSFIWPEGYTALRKFVSVEDPNKMSIYRMEVLKTDLGDPLFRVTSDNGQQFEGHSPSSCWNKIYGDIRKILDACPNVAISVDEQLRMSGLDMFGLSNSEILYLIQDSSKTDTRLSDSKKMQEKVQDLPLGYRPVHVEWNDLDKCSVCHMDEEYMNNLFLQCDKCRIMVHSRCYGELDPFDELWLCNLCRPGAPRSYPSCCLCPVIGGAMKPTTDGRWAHLACAIWIPETCFFDIKRMEPIDGINRISKDRWRLLCTLCGVAYGACIQCSNNACRASYHPLCARAAGLCVEMIDEDRLHLLSTDDEMDSMEQCVSLLSFCKKHKQRTIEPAVVDRKHCQIVRHCSKYSPPSNESGCARCEPYNHFGRRGRKEPEALAAASMKRLFVENQPYLVGGYSGEKVYGKAPMNGGPIRVSPSLDKTNGVEGDTCKTILSAVEKYAEMKNTFRKRLAFGKSGIHGFGIFAKASHKAGDMVIEYTGELVRPSVADRRERLIYNSLVGAGTYMFRIDDERVIDATRAGSIAHLINHSCEPNCYSRALTVNGDDHIIIFAKRDIEQWEELTYDYRFFSIDEHLPCYCGFPRCRGVVNDIESERMVQLQVPQSALKPGIKEYSIVERENEGGRYSVGQMCGLRIQTSS